MRKSKFVVKAPRQNTRKGHGPILYDPADLNPSSREKKILDAEYHTRQAGKISVIHFCRSRLCGTNYNNNANRNTNTVYDTH